MAIVFSELSLNNHLSGDSPATLKVLRRNTDEDNNGESFLSLVNQLATPSGRATEFEMRVVPSGDTGRIVTNNFSTWRTLGTGPASVVHRLEKDDADPPGTISGSVTLNVTVRKINNHVDAVSGVVIFNNTLTTEGEVEPPQPNSFTYEAIFNGLDSFTGIAQLALQKIDESGSLVVRRRLFGTNAQGESVDTDEIVGTHIFEPNSPVPGHAVRITNATLNSGDANIVNNATSYNSANETDLIRVNSYPNSLHSSVTFTATVRRNSDGAVREVWQFEFNVESSN